jgi:hypothetical protein
MKYASLGQYFWSWIIFSWGMLEKWNWSRASGHNMEIDYLSQILLAKELDQNAINSTQLKLTEL